MLLGEFVMITTRRRLLRAAGLAPVALVAVPALAATCPAPDALTPANAAQRKALNYVDPSAIATKRCGVCFWFAATAGGCGKCGLMGGNPVGVNAVCSSFTPKK